MNASTRAAARELVLKRTFDAPRSLVWQAWTDPKRLAAWWGPEGFTAPVCRFEAKAGGEIYIDMKGPDGTVYPMSGEVKEIEPPSRLVFLSAALGDDGEPLFEVLNTITFAEKNGKTELRVHAQVIEIHEEIAAEYLKGMEAGWSQSLDKLADFVAS